MEGAQQGSGTMHYQNGDCYEGSWERGARSGAGRFLKAATGEVFEGHYVGGMREGPGVLYMVSA